MVGKSEILEKRLLMQVCHGNSMLLSVLGTIFGYLISLLYQKQCKGHWVEKNMEQI